MIWVIGDIHGMLDPLKKIITEIRKLHYLWSQEVEKIIFLGDYIDYGPSSKEVIELLLGLEFDTIFLAGNHEDLFLQYFRHSDLFKKYGNIYFRGNGGQEALYSFFPNKKSYHGIYKNLPLDYANFKLEKKYLDFFDNLQYSHTEDIGTNDRKHKFVFAHAGLDMENDITEQLALKIMMISIFFFVSLLAI